VSDKPQCCRLCAATGIEDLGAIPDGDYFAGRVLDNTIPGGRLYRCNTCRSMFKHPILGLVQYMTLYESGIPTQWSGNAGRQDLKIINSLLHGLEALRILDVGCGTGEFLKALPAKHLKFGVEPSPAAVLADLGGINVLAKEIDAVPIEMKFDVITVIDVIEHIANPATLLTSAYDRLVAGGKLIVATGDPEMPLWRYLFKSRFWYPTFPEHISFPSIGFCKIWSNKTGAIVREKITNRYNTSNYGGRALSFLIQTAFYVSPPAFSWVGRLAGVARRARKPRRQFFAPGIPGLFADHQILIIERPIV
jgi:SAM-dependent methyltransferase